MGTATTPTILRGLLVPDPRYRYATTVVATSQAGPLPGVPAPQDATEMVLESSGTQASTAALRVKTVRAGHPGTDAARFVWQNDGDASDAWRGWDPHVSLTGFEFVAATGIANKWLYPHALTLASGGVMIAAGKDKRQTVVQTRSPSTGAWAEVEVYDPGSALTVGDPRPCLVQLPNGRILCFFWSEDSTALYQIRNYYSDDNGATWAPAQKGCLPSPIVVASYTPLRIRAAYLNGQISLIAHYVSVGVEDQIFQYASNDLGATFTQVSTLTGQIRGYPDIVAADGRLVVTYISDVATGSSTVTPRYRIIGSAYESLSAASGGLCQATTDAMRWGTVFAGVFTKGDMSLWRDEDGSLYVMGRHMTSGTYEVLVRRSKDSGSTWAEMGRGPAAPEGASTWRDTDTATYPADFSVCSFGNRGQAVVAHRSVSGVTAIDDSLMVAYLGGYTSVNLPQEVGASTSPETMAGWAFTWTPYDFPEIGPLWTRSTATGTCSLTAFGMRLVTTPGQAEIRDTGLLTGTVGEGIIALAEVRIDGGSASLQLRTSTGTGPLEYEVSAIVSGTSIELYDVAGAATIGSAVATTDASSKFVQILVELRGTTAKMWYRPVVAGDQSRWIEVASTASVTSAAVNNGHRVRIAQGASSDSRWHMVCVSHDSYTEQGLYNQDNWNELLGRSYMPTPVNVDGSTSIFAIDGPTFRNEDWNIDPRYEHAVSNVFPDVAGSPRRAWRSTSDSVQQTIDFVIGATTTRLMGGLCGLYLGDANFGTASLYGKNAGGAWNLITTIDRRAQSSLRWTLSDRLVQPATGGGNTVPHYIHENTLAGSYLSLDAGGEVKKVRKIETNRAGIWNPSLSSLQTRILLTDRDGTEPGSGTAAELWSKDSCTVIPLTTLYREFRLLIPIQTTYEGYFRIGSMVFGSVFPLGSYVQEYGWGRKIEWAADFEQVEGRTGIRTVRALGPTRRAVEVSWVDGIETSGLKDTSPDWVLGWTGGAPVVVPGDLPWAVGGLMEELHGATTPVVYLSSFAVPGNGTTPIHITNRTTMLYSRLASEVVQGDVVVGDEDSTEVIRVGVARLEEEL